MANNATTAAPAARGANTLSAPVNPVDERRFESEIRRIDAAASDEKKSREKFETRIEKSVNDLRDEMNAQFGKVDAQFGKVDAQFDKVDARFDKIDARIDRVEDRLWWIFGAVVLSILAPVMLKYL